MKKPKSIFNSYPVAKVKKDKQAGKIERVAIWLDFDIWQLIKDAAARYYLDNLAYEENRRARLALKRPDKILDWWPRNLQNADLALSLYKLGLETFSSTYAIFKPGEYVTLGRLLELGEKRRRQAYQQYYEYLERLIALEEKEKAEKEAAELAAAAAALEQNDIAQKEAAELAAAAAAVTTTTTGAPHETEKSLS